MSSNLRNLKLATCLRATFINVFTSVTIWWSLSALLSTSGMLIIKANRLWRYRIVLEGSAGCAAASRYPSSNLTCPMPVSLGGSGSEGE